MTNLRKWASVLAAFSLAATLLAGVPAQASSLAPESETIEDPEADAAVLGSSDAEEGTASGGVQNDGAEDADVMTTLTDETSDAGATSGADETSGAGATSGADETSDAGATSGADETSGADTASETAPSDEEEPESGGAAPSDEEEAAAEGETPVEEETASSGVKEDEAEGRDATEEESALPFADVPPNHWSYPFVLYAYEHNLVRGVSETSFNPTGVMTRAAFVTVLYRFSQTIGADMSMGENAFTDIGDINSEFQSAVLWAAAHGIVTGRADATFAPGENVTRQQMCAILMRYLRDYLRYDLSGFVGGAVFADSDSISSYAKEAVSVMQGMDIISGREVDGVTIFDPAGSASRAAVVKVLSSAVQQIPDLSKLPEEVPTDTGDSSAEDNGDSSPESDTATTDGADDSSATDTGDTKKSSGGKSSGSGGSSSGGNGGGSSGGSGGGSSGGGSSSSGGGSATPSGPSPNEPAEAAEVFGYMDELMSACEANPPTDETSKAFMDLIIPTLNALNQARNNGVIVDADYFKAHYSGEVQKLLDKYSETNLEDLMKATDYIRSVVSSTSKVRKIAEYFGVSELLLG